MRLVVLTKGRKRPVGYITPGGYVKTATGWRKIPKGRVGVASVVALPSAVKDKVEDVSYDDILKMSISEMHTLAAEFKVQLSGLDKKSHKGFANLLYQLGMLKQFGFANKDLVTVSFDESDPAGQVSLGGALRSSGTVRALYWPRAKEIVVGKRFKNSFIHEYFHHIFSTMPRDVRTTVVPILKNTKSYKVFQKMDANRDSKYYSASTEMFARLGNQIMHTMLKEKGVKPSVRITDAPMARFDFTSTDANKIRHQIAFYFQQLKKSLLYKAAHKLQGKIDFQGLPISIENRKGSVRHWYDPLKDEHGETKMYYAYGYIRATKGNDGDSIDCYIGPNKESRKVFVVYQNNPKTGKFDENKILLGFDSAREAKAAYLRQYDDPKFFGSMKEMPFDDFQEKVTRKRKGKVYKVSL